MDILQSQLAEKFLPPPTSASKKEMQLDEAAGGTPGAARKKIYNKVVSGFEAKKITVDKYGEEHIEDDNATQKGYVEIALKLLGDLSEDKVNVNMVNMDVQMQDAIVKKVREVITAKKSRSPIGGND